MIAHLRSWWFFKYKIQALEEWTLNGVKLGTKDLNHTMKSVIVRGDYEGAEKSACSNIIQPGDRVLELGGAIGFIGLHCLINCRAESVVSVEANPETAQRLRDNYRRNGLSATIIEAAVAENEGDVQFGVGANFWEDGLTVKEGANQRQITVPGRTFDQLFNAVSPSPNVLVSDIEGAEAAIHWGRMPASIERIIIELHPRQYGFGRMYRMLGAMNEAGFELSYQKGDVFALERPTAQKRANETTP